LVPLILKELPAFYGTWRSLTRLTNPTTGFCPEPDESIPYPLNLFLYGPFYCYAPTYAWVFQAVSLSLSLSPPPLHIFQSTPCVYFSSIFAICPSNPISLDLLLLIMVRKNYRL
jgi:hypothetical protein